jgi:hypothetical protein
MRFYDGTLVIWTFQRLCIKGGGPGVEPGGLHNFCKPHKPQQSNKRVPRGSPSLGHVALFYSTMNCHVSIPHSSKVNQSNTATSPFPTQLPHHRTKGTACHVSCTACPVNILFFPVWLGEQIAITSPYGLRLRK